MMKLVIKMRRLALPGQMPAGRSERFLPHLVSLASLIVMLALLSAPLAQAQTPPPAPQVTLWHPYSGPTRQTLEALVTEFNQTNPDGITVETVAQETPGSLYDQIILALQQPDNITLLPHIAVVRPAEAGLFALSGQVVELSDYVATSDTIDDLMPSAATLGRDMVNNRWGWPLHLHAYVLLVNETALAHLAMNGSAASWNIFGALACGFREHGGWPEATLGEVWGAVVPLEGDFLQALLMSNGYLIIGGDPLNLIIRPAAADLLADLATWAQAGCIRLEGDVTARLEAFVSGRALFYLGTTAELAAVQSGIASYFVEPFAWRVEPLPGTATLPAEGVIASLFDHGPVDNAAAWQFLQWWTAPAQNVRWAAAVQGLPVTPAAGEAWVEEWENFPQWRQVWLLVTDESSDLATLPILPGGDVLTLEMGLAWQQMLAADVTAGPPVEALEALEGRLNEIMAYFAH